MTQRKAVVLVSGGLDSATVLALAKSQNYELYALSFRYGQRHIIELEAAKRVVDSIGVQAHKTIDIDLRAFGGSALTDDIDVPKFETSPAPANDIPVTYVPARNTIFLSYALGWAEVLGAYDIFIGANAVDYSGYPDCRPAFIDAFTHLANLATEAGVTGKGVFTVHTPLIDWKKSEIIRKGLSLGVNYALTTSCYDPLPSGKPCQQCDSCHIRQDAFSVLGKTDPLLLS